MNKLNIKKLGDEELQDLFTEAFEKKVAMYNNISEFECKSIKDSINDKVTIEVTIVGFAGSPNVEDFIGNKVKDSKTIIVSKDGFEGNMIFELNTKRCIAINTSDYLLIYDLKK